MLNWLNKNNQNKGNLIFFGAFAAFFLISFRKIFLIKGILGHNWDWTLPGLGFLFNKLNILSNYTWWDFNLGLPLNLTISHLIPNTGLGLLSRLLGIRITILSLLVFIIAVSSLSFKKLLDVIIEETKTNYIPSFLYAFSPFLFNEIIGGSWYMWISYAFAPVFFVNLLKFIHTKRTKNLIGFLLSAIFVISSLQNFVLIEAIIILYLIYQVVLEREDLKKVAFGYFFSHVVLVLFNLYWILTFVYSLPGFGQVISHSSFTGAFQSVQASTQDLLSILSLTGYLDRNMYYFALPDFMVPVFIFFVFLVWVLVILSIVLKRGISENKVNIWLLILLFMIIFIKGGNPPFSSLTMWLYNHLPLMRLYRSPQHLMFAAAFVVPVLVAFLLNYFCQTSKHSRVILAFFSFAIFIWISGWWFNGDLGHEVLKNKQRDYIDFYTLSPGLQKVYERNEESSLNHRILFLPAVLSPQYLETKYQNKAQGGQPEYMYLKNPTFTSESNPFANRIETILGKNMEFNYINYLRLFSVRDIVLRYDIYPLFTESARYWDSNKVKEILDSPTGLNKFLEGEYEIGYSIKPEYFLPHFYVPEKLVYSDGDIEILPDVVSFGDYPARSVIYTEESGELIVEEGGLPNKANEVFVKANLKNPLSEKELGEIAPELESVFFPYVRWKPGSLVYPLILKKEEFDEWMVRKDQEKLLDKKLFYASKRISEIEKWGEEIDLSKVLARYQSKMEEVIGLLKEDNWQDKKIHQQNVLKTEIYLEAQWEKIISVELEKGEIEEIRDIFEELRKEVKDLKTEYDLSKLDYNFRIPKEGTYQLLIKIEGFSRYLKETQSELDFLGEKITVSFPSENENWISVDSFNLEKGEEELSLTKPQTLNLLGTDNWRDNLTESIFVKNKLISAANLQQAFPKGSTLYFKPIENYQGNSSYKITFDYFAYGGEAGITLIQDVEIKQRILLFSEKLLKTEMDSPRHVEKVFKSTPGAETAEFYFWGKAERIEDFKIELFNVKIEIVFEPTIILHTTQYQKPAQTPKITFIKINPTKYKVKIEGAKEPYTLVFSESFHEGWKAYVNNTPIPKESREAGILQYFNTPNIYGEIVASYFDGEIKEGTHKNIFLDRSTFETWRREPISKDKHLLVNGYANSWYITPEDVNGAENYELIIEFWPQRTFYLGMGISLLTLLGCLGYLGYDLAKKRIEKNK